ncbi:MAG: ArsA-related P-loop ATPase, partial [Myxococcota bacterium]|nr:ArsA-related P-loop ATPase [Myxococcota bacterium]
MTTALIDKRLIFVTGKGGTGKSTVTAGLAAAAARGGLRVLVIEVGSHEAIPPLIAPGGPPVGHAGRRVGRPYAVVLHGSEVTVPGRLPVARSMLARVLRGASLVIC